MKTSEIIFKIKDFNPTTKVLATGTVLGHLWGGGLGAYSAKQLSGNTVEEVTKEAEDLCNSGALDSGMGFESLKGAKMTLHIITRIELEERTFENIEYETIIIGHLTEEELDMLGECE